ncbi:IS3 family transposase [Brevibacillus sp. HB2.2]|uniref:IS3 family transposase n=1 Tax=Brevibacillus sp. HB2.2 TaxID=2738846 RepID=UPI0028117BB2|nr:IS3 family transposase [Brevibacillus sp. HB2.2]
MQFYNDNRPQRKLKKLTPVEFRRQLSILRPGLFSMSTYWGLDHNPGRDSFSWTSIFQKRYKNQQIHNDVKC